MIIYGLMKYIEKIPVRYDRIMNILTLGHLRWSRKMMLSQVRPGMRILDMGCGTGDFAISCALAGALVTCVDSSPEMLRVFREKQAALPDRSIADLIEIHEVGAASMDSSLKGREFDLVTASLMLGELPDPVRNRALLVASSLLAPGGRLLICDELWPEDALPSLIYHILFWIFFIPNFILTRTLIQPVKGLPASLDEAGLKITRRVDLLFGSMSIVWAERKQ